MLWILIRIAPAFSMKTYVVGAIGIVQAFFIKHMLLVLIKIAPAFSIKTYVVGTH